MENRLVAPQRVRHAFAIWPSRSTPRHLLGGIEKRLPHQNLYVNIHSSIIHTAPKWKQPKCPSTEERINTIWCNSCNGILFSHEKG